MGIQEEWRIYLLRKYASTPPTNRTIKTRLIAMIEFIFKGGETAVFSPSPAICTESFTVTDVVATGGGFDSATAGSASSTAADVVAA